MGPGIHGVSHSLGGFAVMVSTKAELIGSLQHEVHILLHLASKVDRSKLAYRPTPKQRSTIELLRYLSIMGPGLVQAANAGDLDATIAAIAAHKDAYASLLGGVSDADFRVEIEMFGRKTTRGAFMVNSILSGCAAYRTQLFCYLKACGRDELNTMNLWAGVDAPVPG
jgi:hypothetical protein